MIRICTLLMSKGMQYNYIYIENRVPHKGLGKMTPREAFNGKKTDVSTSRYLAA